MTCAHEKTVSPNELDIYTLADGQGNICPKLLSVAPIGPRQYRLVTERWQKTLRYYPIQENTAILLHNVLDRLHRLQVLHLDLHLDNFLVQEPLEMALIDFGYSYRAAHLQDLEQYKLVEHWLLQTSLNKVLGIVNSAPPALDALERLAGLAGWTWPTTYDCGFINDLMREIGTPSTRLHQTLEWQKNRVKEKL